MKLSKRKLQTRGSTETLSNDVQSYVGGNRKAFERISHHLESIINSVLYSKRYSFDPNVIDDLKQECWLEILRKLARWDPNRGSLRTFLSKCLTNLIATYFRHPDCDSQYLPVEDIEFFMDPEVEEQILTNQDLNIQVSTRLTGAVAMYVLRRISIAVYYRSFDHHRTRIIKELCEMSGRPQKEIGFMVDYSLVALRRHSQEISCQKKMRTSILSR